MGRGHMFTGYTGPLSRSSAARQSAPEGNSRGPGSSPGPQVHASETRLERPADWRTERPSITDSDGSVILHHPGPAGNGRDGTRRDLRR